MQNSSTTDVTNSDMSTMSVFAHLEELRKCLIISIVTIFVGFCAALFLVDRIVNFLKTPLIKALEGVAGPQLYFTGPLDVMFVNLKVSFFVSLIGTSPIWFYQFWQFIEPALYPTEKKYVIPFFLVSLFQFALGLVFCYVIILPVGLKFLIGLGLEVGQPLITITDYISLLSALMLGFGMVFETPVLLVLLALLGIVKVEYLTKYRKAVVVIVLVVAAVLTPTTDPFSQLAMAIPTYLMYEISILVIKLIRPSRKGATGSCIEARSDTRIS